jgi:cold shock CspA family protein
MTSTQTDATTPLVTSSSDRPSLIGRVKWFNNKTGYGFITVTDGDRAGTDIFVHHSSIMVSLEQYKYLVQGEYIQFKIDTTATGSHDIQAGEVSGINGGKLMCETRRDFRQTRTAYDQTASAPDDDDEPEVKMPRSTRAPKARGSGTPTTPAAEWTLVKGRDANDSSTPRSSGPRSGGRGGGGRGLDRGRGSGGRPPRALVAEA